MEDWLEKIVYTKMKENLGDTLLNGMMIFIQHWLFWRCLQDGDIPELTEISHA